MPERDNDKIWERWVEETLKGRHLVEPPDGVLRRALDLGKRLRPDASHPTTGRWWIELLFDSLGQPLPAGVRGSGSSERRLLFRLEPPEGDRRELQLDLRLRCVSDAELQVTGQVLPPWEDAVVEARAARSRARRSVGPDGEFLLDGLSAAAKTLELTIHGVEGEPLEIPAIELRLGAAPDGGRR